MRELRSRARWDELNAARLEERARASARAAADVRSSGTGLEASHASAIACELYRQSVYWALLAHEARLGQVPGSKPRSQPAGPEELRRLWSVSEGPTGPLSGLAPDVLAGAARDFVGTSFVELAELSPDERRTVSARLRQVVEALLSAGARTREQINAVWIRRLLLCGLLVISLGLAVAIPGFVRGFSERRSDLAQGRPWQASSNAGTGGCSSPEQSCRSSSGYFFHTRDENNPWVEIDLGSARPIAKAVIVNRTDCCSDRAVPLSIEVSLDRQRYLEVARKSSEFATWRAKFAPVQARYVRIRAARQTMLHLSRVRVLPP